MSIYELLIYLCLALMSFRLARSNHVVLLLFIVTLIIVASIRDLSVGTDTLSYYDSFKSQSTTHREGGVEVLYIIWESFFRAISNYSIFMVATYSLILIPIYKVIKRYSPIYMLSIFIFITCGFYTFGLNGMRQMISISILYLAFNSLYNNNNTKFWLYLIIACLFHYSSIAGLLLFFIKDVTFNRKLIALFIIISFIVGFYFLHILKPYFVILSAYVGDQYGTYLLYDGIGTRNFITNFGMNILFLSTLCFATDEVKDNIFYKTYFISMILFNLFGGMYLLARVVTTFALSQIIVFPQVINGIRKKYIRYTYIAMMLIYCFFRFYVITLESDEVLPYTINAAFQLI